MNNNSSSGERVLHSYGSTTEIFAFLNQTEVLKLEAVNKWLYMIGVSRVQVKIKRR